MTAAPVVPPAPPRLFTRDFVLLLGATFGALANYAPLLSVVPLWAASGGASDAWVGSTTGVMMGATVLTQLSMGRLFRVLSLRGMLVLGSLLLALATPAYALSPAIAPLLAISAVRGVGFALVVVAGAALAAELVASTRLSTATGVYGVAAGLPNVVALPAGVWLAQTWGFLPMFLATSALALVAVPLAATMPRGRVARARASRSTGTLAWRAVLAPTAVFFVTAVALGGATTFLPLAEPAPGTASAALFALSLTMVLARVGAGRLGERTRPGRLLLPAAVLAALGMAGVAAATATGAGPLVVLAAAVFGVGFGAAQNDSLVVVLRHAGPTGYGSASVVWNVAYDAGMGAGAVALGVVVGLSSHGWGFALLAAAVAALVPTAWSAGRRAPGRRPIASQHLR